MSKPADIQSSCDSRRGPHGATHQDWSYSRDALIWIADKPMAPNLHPFAEEMCEWLQQKRRDLPSFEGSLKGEVGAYTNPFTYSASAIRLALADIVNSAYEFSESDEPLDPVDAEVRRIRFYTEFVLYAARFCEVTIKQMLFCTQIPKKLYLHAPLGKLLFMECKTCRAKGKTGHDISLLGSLAHQFWLCHTLDACAIDHLLMVNKRRNLDAAHSDSQLLNFRTAAESRADLNKALDEVGWQLGHMAQHIGEIERAMISESNLYLKYDLQYPPIEDLMRIDARPRPGHPALAGRQQA